MTALVQDTALQVSAPTLYGTPRTAPTGPFYFFIGLGAFLLFGLLRFFYSKYINELVNILSKSTLGRMASKEGMWQSKMPRLFFLLIYFLAAGYIIGRLIHEFSALQAVPWQFWLWGVLVLLGVHSLKYLASHSVALIFQMTKTVRMFFHHISVVHQLLGVALLPICGILMFVSDPIGRILILFSGFLLLVSLVYKALINFAYVRNSPKVRFLYFILYLCLFEFIPLAVLVRYVLNNMGA